MPYSPYGIACSFSGHAGQHVVVESEGGVVSFRQGEKGRLEDPCVDAVRLLLEQLDALTFGPEGMPMPLWVFYNASELPGGIVGFGDKRWRTSGAEGAVKLAGGKAEFAKGGTLGHPWGNAAGAAANRVSLEACVQARNEGRDLEKEGKEILTKAAEHSPELKMAMETWKEIKFEFDTVDKLDVVHR